MLMRMFMAAPNYMLSLVGCLACTVMAALTDSPKLYWLIVSDINVAIWLLVAYWLDPNRKSGGALGGGG